MVATAGGHSFKLCIYTGSKHEYLQCTRDKKCNEFMGSTNSNMLFFKVVATPPKGNDSFCKLIQCNLNIKFIAIRIRRLNVDHSFFPVLAPFFDNEINSV